MNNAWLQEIADEQVRSLMDGLMVQIASWQYDHEIEPRSGLIDEVTWTTIDPMTEEPKRDAALIAMARNFRTQMQVGNITHLAPYAYLDAALTELDAA